MITDVSVMEVEWNNRLYNMNYDKSTKIVSILTAKTGQFLSNISYKSITMTEKICLAL